MNAENHNSLKNHKKETQKKIALRNEWGNGKSILEIIQLKKSNLVANV